ncbi:hypothetical protein B5X24_HaOG216187 [Helicoverpa armigera]|uniref:Peptidase A2 domain-containing protein n=1 Tax=Helicoverpa armigera TaxID=29058 RepID=A0A2W1B7Y8_HELAM|nr:hypothetical protein B5X24_HaOG216187 [Helicoverpa armigera]
MLSSQIYASKTELRNTLFQIKDLLREEQRKIMNLPIIPHKNDAGKYERSFPCTNVNTHNAFSVKKEAPPSKDVEMKQHDEEQHAEQPVALLAIGSEVAYKSGETGPFINVLIAQQEFRALVDTGASISCVSEEFATKLNIQCIKESAKHSATTVSGADLTILGEASLNLLIDSCFFSHKFLIIKNINQNLILGRDFLCKNNCLIDFSKNHLILKTRFIAKFIDTGTLDIDRSVSKVLTVSDGNNVITRGEIVNNLNKINNICFQSKVKGNNIRNKLSQRRNRRYVPKCKKSYNVASSEMMQCRRARPKDLKKSNSRKFNIDNCIYPSEGRKGAQYKKQIQLRNIDDNLVFLNRQNVDKYKDRKHFR